MRKLAGEDGRACFVLLGGAKRGDCSAAGCGVIRADGVLIGTCSVAALDLDSAGQLGPSDMSLWMDDFFATLCPRIDCDCSGAITAADLSFFQQRYFASFIQGCDGQRCP